MMLDDRGVHALGKSWQVEIKDSAIEVNQT